MYCEIVLQGRLEIEEFVLQYKKLHCNCGARARLDCIAIQWPAKPRYSRGWVAGARAGACWARRQAQGRWAGVRGARRQRAAGSRASTELARRGAQLGARCARGTAGLGVAWALDGCAGWASWASFGALCTWLSSDSVFGPGSTRYFPESPNEHCSW